MMKEKRPMEGGVLGASSTTPTKRGVRRPPESAIHAERERERVLFGPRISRRPIGDKGSNRGPSDRYPRDSIRPPLISRETHGQHLSRTLAPHRDDRRRLLTGGAGGTLCSQFRRAVPVKLTAETPLLLLLLLPPKYAAQGMDQGQPPVENWCGLWSNGMDLLNDARARKHFLPTGLEGIDVLLGGGLREGQLTEITGQSSSGKTQVCLCSASHVAARHMGVVLYLDTSNSFSPSRIARITDELPISLVKEPKDVRLKRVMSSIICESVFDIFALFEVLDRLELSLNDKVNNGSGKICLLIIDSISSLLAPIIGGKNSQGRSMMISVAMILKKLADKHNLSVLVTNHMVAGNGVPKPALGESWKAVPHVRLMISRDRGNNMCTAIVLKHTLLASGRRMKFVVPS